MPNNRPVILVHGLLGFGPKELGPLNYWGGAFKVASPLPRYEASIGPLSSAHDRACELAAQIKGTRVDYGARHARKAGHARFGDDFTGQGFVPDWNAANAVHLVGHSLGSPTIRCLQHLLAVDYWGWGSDHRWVASISTISGVSNGSTLVYFFGVDERTGRLRRGNGITPILLMLEVFTQATGGFLESIYDFDLGHWGFARDPDESVVDYLLRVAESPFFWGADNAAYSLSLQGAFADNGVWNTYADTYYFAYVTEQTTRGWFSGRYYPDPLMNPALLALSSYIGRKEFSAPPIPLAGFQSAHWWENDGLVPTYSQLYPHTNGAHPVGGAFDDNTPLTLFETGKWYSMWERDIDHLDICITPQLTQFGKQRRFYRDLFLRLAALSIDL
jgi:triacylglycerol esterase/lipase EstA (alpha/beta hydrolase family)